MLTKYFISLGLSFASIYICREETIWVLPFLGLSIVVTILFIVFDKMCLNKIKKLCLYTIPIFIFIATILIVCTLNYKFYRVFQLNQYWSKEFKEAYGAMTRVLPEQEIEKVPITKETMEKISTISPTFAEICPSLKTSILKWSMCGDGKGFEVQGGWIHWAIMEAVERSGYYDNAQKANEFYKKVADEINMACDNRFSRMPTI